MELKTGLIVFHNDLKCDVILLNFEFTTKEYWSYLVIKEDNTFGEVYKSTKDCFSESENKYQLLKIKGQLSIDNKLPDHGC